VWLGLDDLTQSQLAGGARRNRADRRGDEPARGRGRPAVIGPIVAATKRPEVAAGRPTRSTKLRTVDDEVKVTASMRPSLMSAASLLRSSSTGTVR